MVLAHGFTGLYVDANAISPQRAERIAAAVRRGGARFVDGSIIGPPAWKPGTTWLYLRPGRGGSGCALRRRPGAGHRAGVRLAGPGAEDGLCRLYQGQHSPACRAPRRGGRAGVRGDLTEQWQREGSGMDENAAARPGRDGQSLALRGRDGGDRRHLRGGGTARRLPRRAADVYRRLARLRTHRNAPARRRARRIAG